MSIYNDPANPRAKEMFASITKYLSSELTQKQFCQKENLAYSTFQKWLQIYRKSHKKSVSDSSPTAFIPIAIPKHQSAGEKPQCIIEFPNGIIIRFNGKFDSQLIQSLVENR